MSFRNVLTALLLLGVAATANGQINPYNALNRRAQQQANQAAQMQPAAQTQAPVSVDGTIESVTKDSLRVMGKDQQAQPWQVFLAPDTRVKVTGTAEASFLRKGLPLNVEFQAELDAQAKGADVDALTLVTPSRERPPGLSRGNAFAKPAEHAAAKAADRGAAAKAAEPAAKAAEHAVAKTAATAKTGSASRNKGIEPGTYHVVGRIMSFRDNLLIVQTGHAQVKVNLTESPTITLDTSNLAYADVGDEVTVKGIPVANRAAIPRSSRMMQRPVATNPQGIQNQAVAQGSHIVQAQDITIKISQPLSSGKKRATAAKASAKDSADNPKKDADADGVKKAGDKASKTADDK